jgi:hypothetical protein
LTRRQELLTKQAQIKREKTKEEYTPFLTISGQASALQKHTEPKSTCEKLFSTQRPLVLGQLF